jgi:hypothetical protein
MSTVKPKTLFDHLAGITWKKTPWEDLSEADRKSFTPYLINRWLSMNPDYIEIVDMFQQYTIGPLSKKHVYQLYYDLLPKAKTFNKYIKGKKATKYNKELIELLAVHFGESYRAVTQYLELMPIEEVKAIVEMYGKSDKEVKQLLKLTK